MKVQAYCYLTLKLEDLLGNPMLEYSFAEEKLVAHDQWDKATPAQAAQRLRELADAIEEVE